MRNLNLLFHKEYYQAIGTKAFNDDVKKHNSDILSAVFTEKDYVPSKVAKQTFILTTKYPGLLIGTGNPHGAGDLGNSDEDVNIGFSFDYVTGQPYIPGSSVKGLLRSFFKYYPDRTNPVEEILRCEGFEDIEKDDVKNLEKSIFDYGDTFFDAIVYDGDENGRLMGFDYITPHKSATANPIPIRIIKVLPDVRFEFRFILSDKKIRDMDLTAEALKDLFQKLLVLFGAGAKTNVGYGILTEDESDGRRKQKKKAHVSGTNEQKKATTPQKRNTPKVICPQCGFSNYKYSRDGVTLTETCYKCHKPLK